MATLTNAEKRDHHLPPRKAPDGKSYAPGVLTAGGSLAVPDWYLDELANEKGWARRFASGVVHAERTSNERIEPRRKSREE